MRTALEIKNKQSWTWAKLLLNTAPRSMHFSLFWVLKWSVCRSLHNKMRHEVLLLQNERKDELHDHVAQKGNVYRKSTIMWHIADNQKVKCNWFCVLKSVHIVALEANPTCCFGCKTHSLQCLCLLSITSHLCYSNTCCFEKAMQLHSAAQLYKTTGTSNDRHMVTNLMVGSAFIHDSVQLQINMTWLQSQRIILICMMRELAS